MSKFLDCTKNDKKSRKKVRKIIFGSELSEMFMSQLLDDKKSRKKVQKIICRSELSETNNEPTFRFLNF